MDISIRTLTDNDLETADTILSAAFQDKVSRVDALQLYRKIQPDGWFLVFRQEQPVGTVGAANYGPFAHVGLMAVHPDFQRQGFGLEIMQFLLAHLNQQHVPLVTLDASKIGRPLYEKLGFIPYDETLMFQRNMVFSTPDRPSNIHAISDRDLDELVQWDTPLFGANRRKVFLALLTSFPERAFMTRDEAGQLSGVLFAQKNRIGPWATEQPENAEQLLQVALALSYEGSVSVAVPAVNLAAMELLQRYGFKLLRANCHMGRGAGGPPGQRWKIYAQTSLAVG
jgi:predicted N-acetyltransferase YhbS